jgi:hypothetical protein
MPSKHKHDPLSVRFPEELRAWVFETAAAAGRSRGSLIVEAVRAFRERRSSLSPETEPKENES